MPAPRIAIASARSFGDFVIAHSVLHRVEAGARARIRLIACNHVRELNSVLPGGVRVTLLNSGGRQVPAIFDVKKRGAWAAAESALSLRREFRAAERSDGEALAFSTFGIRERFIAGGWRVLVPRKKAANIYETYRHFLAEHEIKSCRPPAPSRNDSIRTVGVFPESRLAEKRLTAATLTQIFERASCAGLDATLYLLEGDPASYGVQPRVVTMPRNFASLTKAINSVDCVISADSLPAHLAEYYARQVFVASSVPNEYWLPHGSFVQRQWGTVGETKQFSVSLDAFFSRLRTG
jgi:hypothetical protein